MKTKKKENRYLPSTAGISELEVYLGKTLANNNNKLVVGGDPSKLSHQT